jgi:tetratricopeptide (TPR) repeat protein
VIIVKACDTSNGHAMVSKKSHGPEVHFADSKRVSGPCSCFLVRRAVLASYQWRFCGSVLAVEVWSNSRRPVRLPAGRRVMLMAKWPGGLDPMEVQRGLDAIRSAKCMDDLLEAIDKVPVLRSPVFHTILNANAGAAKSPGLDQLIDIFFTALAAYVYMAHCRNAVAPATTGDRKTEHEHWPHFYKAVCEQLNGKVPANYPHCLEPSRDIERLVFEIAEVADGHVALPDYRPTEGSTWSVVAVMCATCEAQRAEVFANSVDLTVASDLLPAVRDGQINDACCPRCGQPRCYPIRLWIREDPGPADTVAALSGILRLDKDSWVYLPPPGTPREMRDERLYESRAASMLKLFRWRVHSKPESAAVGVSVSIAYNKEDLIRMAEQILTDRSRSELPVDIPFAMKALWDEAARNMRSGLWPVVEASKIVGDAVSEGTQDWPLLIYLPLDPLEIHRRLALCFIREGLAERTIQDVPTRLKLKLDTFKALLQKGQLALADAKLREAQDLLGEMPVSAPERKIFEPLVGLCRVELLDAQGKSLEASHLETAVMDTLPRSDRTVEAEMLGLRAASAKALEHKHEGRWLEALKELRRCVLDWTSLIDRIPDSGTADSQKRLEACAASLSSDGANLANVLEEFRRHVRALRILSQLAEGVSPSDEDRLWMAQTASIVRVAPEVVNDAALDELEDFLGAKVSEKRLWDRSLELLEQSLGLSTQIQAWELAAIQAHNMGMLLFEGKVFDQADIYMQRAVEYAERIGDDTRIIQGCALLARLASKRGAGEETIKQATKAIETYGRNLLSRGHTARPNIALQRLLTRLVLEAVSVGGALEQAVVLVENLKALTLVNSLFSERPDQPRDSGPSLSRDATSDVRERLEEVRLQTIFAADPQRGEGSGGDLEKTIRESVEQRSLQDPRFSKWVDSSDFALTTVAGLRQRLRLLGDRTTFLGVAFDGIDLWTYALWSDGCKVLKATLPDEDWPSSGEPVTNLERLSRLGKTLLEPLIGRSAVLTTRDHVVFSSCPELYTVPITALPWSGGRLVESVIVDVVQGAGVFEACIRRPFNRLDSLLCVGNPSRPDLPPLKRAEDEAKLLESQFGARGKSVKLLLRHKATVPAFIDSADDYDICHMACHGEFLEIGGCLKLAPDVAHKDSGELTEMRILTEVRTKPGALVNLAGCSTGVQRETGALMIGGLVPVWMLTGASGVVASLWPIEDNLAETFQRRLYRYVLNGSRPDEALALTQRDCIVGELNEAMRRIEVWAPFQFYGCLVPNNAEGFL